MKRHHYLILACIFSGGCRDAESGSADTDGTLSSGTTEALGETSDGPDAESSTGLPPPPAPRCEDDLDRDGLGLADDNADGAFNPGQRDRDADGLGDVMDLCAFSVTDPNNTADSDNDGVGNECDRCRANLGLYNADAEAAGIDPTFRVRNNPHQRDSDGDGIADPCDNCVTVPNCQGYGTDGDVFAMGDVSGWDGPDCQLDTNHDMVGDACEGLQQEGAAGQVGFGPSDDFDQDGIANLLDACPRLPVSDAGKACAVGTEIEDCGSDRPCVDGVCGHVDTDADGVGDLCDTCSEEANADQRSLYDVDDADGDFIGIACEAGAAERRNAPTMLFVEVSHLDRCCTAELLEIDEGMAATSMHEEGDLIRVQDCDLSDLDSCTRLTRLNPAIAELEEGDVIDVIDIPVRTASNCTAQEVAAFECAMLPAAVRLAPGILEPPVGCASALEAAGLSAAENRAAELSSDDFGAAENPDEALWQHGCQRPPIDEDFDGLPNAVDSCSLVFDPTGAIYVDDSGQEWPTDGAACQGNFGRDALCALREATGE